MFVDIHWTEDGDPPPGPEQDDIFALTENGRSVITWTRGNAAEARFTLAATFSPGVSRFLGVVPRPGELIPAHAADKLSRLETERSRGWWVGGHFKSMKRLVAASLEARES